MRDKIPKVFFVSFMSIFILIFLKMTVGVFLKKQKKPPIPVKSPENNFQVVKKTGVNAAFLQEGKIWLIDKGERKKMLSIDEKKGSVVDFAFSPDFAYLYYLTDKGELWKRKRSGETSVLVSESDDMTPTRQDSIGDSQPFEYMKGKVLSFHLSPDGNYITYDTLESHTATGYTIIVAITSFRVMNKDGREKILISKPSGISRQLTFFDGWLPDSRSILLHYAAPDEATQGSYFYQASVDGKVIKKFSSILYSNDLTDTVTVAGAAPAFSPNNQKLAFIEDGVNGEGKVWVTALDGSEKRILIEKGFQLGTLKWSSQGTNLLAYNDLMLLFFYYEDVPPLQFSFSAASALQAIVPPANQPQGMSNEKYIHNYIAGGYKNEKDRKLTVFMIYLPNREKAEKSIDFPFDFTRTSLEPQFVAEDREFAYLIKQHSDKDNKSLSQLWLFDWKTKTNYKIIENVDKIVPIKSFDVFAFNEGEFDNQSPMGEALKKLAPDLFNDSSGVQLEPAKGHILLTSIRSNDNQFAAYSQIGECAERLWVANANYEDWPDCTFDYSIQLKDLTTGTSKEIYSDKVTKTKQAAVFSRPLAFIRGDKQILFELFNPHVTGTDEPHQHAYSLYSLETNKTVGLAPGDAIFSDGYERVFYLDRSDKELPLCAPRDYYNLNHTKIVIRNLVSGKFSALIEDPLKYYEMNYELNKERKNKKVVYYKVYNMIESTSVMDGKKCAEFDGKDPQELSMDF